MFETTNQIIHGQSLVVRKKTCSSFALWLVIFHFVQMFFGFFGGGDFVTCFSVWGTFPCYLELKFLICIVHRFSMVINIFSVVRIDFSIVLLDFSISICIYIYVYIYIGWGTTLLGVLGVNSFIGCYQCFPINSIVGLDLAFLIKHYHVISFCFLSSHWCFTRCRHDSCSILPRNHKSQKNKKPKPTKGKQTRN